MRPVNFSKSVGCGGIQRGGHEISGKESLPHRFSGKKGAVRQHSDWDRRRFFDLPDELPDLGVQSRLSGPGKSDVINPPALSERFFDLSENVPGGEELPAALSFLRRPSELTVNAVESTGFIGKDIDTERKPEAPGRDRSVDVRERLRLFLGSKSF